MKEEGKRTGLEELTPLGPEGNGPAIEAGGWGWGRGVVSRNVGGRT